MVSVLSRLSGSGRNDGQSDSQGLNKAGIAP